MPTFSKQAGWDAFLTLCQQADSKEKLEKIFSLHLTQEEREDIAMRYLIVRELLKGELTQRDMADKLGVSIAKITRGSNALKTIPEDFKACLHN